MANSCATSSGNGSHSAGGRGGGGGGGGGGGSSGSSGSSGSDAVAVAVAVAVSSAAWSAAVVAAEKRWRTLTSLVIHVIITVFRLWLLGRLQPPQQGQDWMDAEPSRQETLLRGLRKRNVY